MAGFDYKSPEQIKQEARLASFLAGLRSASQQNATYPAGTNWAARAAGNFANAFTNSLASKKLGERTSNAQVEIAKNRQSILKQIDMTNPTQLVKAAQVALTSNDPELATYLLGAAKDVRTATTTKTPAPSELEKLQNLKDTYVTAGQDTKAAEVQGRIDKLTQASGEGSITPGKVIGPILQKIGQGEAVTQAELRALDTYKFYGNPLGQVMNQAINQGNATSLASQLLQGGGGDAITPAETQQEQPAAKTAPAQKEDFGSPIGVDDASGKKVYRNAQGEIVFDDGTPWKAQ